MLWNVNRFSYLIAAALAMGGAWAAGARLGGLAAPLAAASVGLGLAAAQRKFRGGPSSVGSWQQVQHALGRGVPTLLFVYSDT